MTATSALERIEDLIEIATQRLIPQALQRLSTAEILGEYEPRNRASTASIPSRDDLGVPADLEVAYSRLIKFLRLHEPTGTEKDVAQKREVVRSLSLQQMLQECKHAKLPHIQVACFQKVVDWFEESNSGMGSGSASAPILPPRMSPKKTGAINTSPEGVAMLSRSASQDAIPTAGTLDMMKKAAVAQKLSNYKMPDLRASHIRRVAQLKSRGVDVPAEDLELLNGIGPEQPEDHERDILEPEEYELRDRRDKIKSTFKAYEPETETEYAMNQMWLERKHTEEVEKQKAQEVRSKMQSWSMSKSRDESEYLRKHEAMQLAAGLEKLVEEEYDALSLPRRLNVEKKKQEWQAIQQSVPHAVVVDTEKPEDTTKGSRTSGAAAHVTGPTTPSRSGVNELVLSVKKKKSNAGAGGPATPVGAGGMHFRNQLPPNYTPQSKRSNGTPTSFSSKDGSRSSPSTPLSTSSSGKLQLLDEAAARAEGRTSRGFGVDSSPSPPGSEESPAIRDEDERIETSTFQPGLKFSERMHDPRGLKFQPFFPASQTQQGSLPLARAVSASALSRKLHPRGTIPPQAEPIDPEYRHLYAATASRKPPLPVSILPDKPLPGLGRNSTTVKAGSGSNNQQDQSTARRNSLTSKRLTSAIQGGLSSSPSEQLMSDLRAEQMQEVERIRILFQHHNLTLSTGVLERGLLIPEDKSTLECIQNLPLPGSQLISNPLLKVKVKTTKTTKKKKKKKGTKGGKTKSKASAGDKSKSPKKKKKA